MNTTHIPTAANLPHAEKVAAIQALTAGSTQPLPVRNAAAFNPFDHSEETLQAMDDGAETLAEVQAFLEERDSWLQSRVAFHASRVPF